MTDGRLDESELRAALDDVLHRVDRTLDATGDRFPLFADPATGEWETTADGNWCGGHWIALLRLAAEHADPGDADRFTSAADDLTPVMRGADDLRESMFAGMNYLYAGFRSYDLTGDRSQFGLGLTGADAMVGNFHEAAQQVPIGEYEVAGPSREFNFSAEAADHPSGTRAGSSDSVYTALPVLWRAYEETGNERFRDVAVTHANRHVKWYLRDDGSTWNRTVFDPETGEADYHHNALAHSDDTCWARGQGWITAGLAFAYRATGAPRFLDALERVVGYYVQQSPDDLVPYWDFEDPAIPDAPRDTSAAALVAYGLLHLDGDGRGGGDGGDGGGEGDGEDGGGDGSDADRVAALRRTGERVLDSILSDYLVSEGERRGMILEGCYVQPSDYGVDADLIWTDYYVAYTLHRLLRD